MCSDDVSLVFVCEGEPIDAVYCVDGGCEAVVEYLAGGKCSGVDVGTQVTEGVDHTDAFVVVLPFVLP